LRLSPEKFHNSSIPLASTEAIASSSGEKAIPVMEALCPTIIFFIF